MASYRDQTTRGASHPSENADTDMHEAVDSINMFDDDFSDPDWMSDALSSADDDSDDCPLDQRLQEPTGYFQELDSLETNVFGNSMFQFYIVNFTKNFSITC